jgi:hypothetical protein
VPHCVDFAVPFSPLISTPPIRGLMALRIGLFSSGPARQWQ